MRQIVLLVAVAFLAGCANSPVDQPCGVIRDDLKTVMATTPAGQQRLDVHFVRGKEAGCWK